jgi:hypothetical protein
MTRYASTLLRTKELRLTMDQIEFNTQCSSQWDSLCHYNHQPTGLGYNGVKGSIEIFTQNFGEEDKDQKYPTLNRASLS